MKRSVLSLLLALTLAVFTLTACGESEKKQEQEKTAQTEAATESPDLISDELSETIKPLFEQNFLEHGYLGAAYAVYHGEEVYAGGAGKADKKSGLDNGADVVYRIASVTKQFTAAAILQLCEQGKMNLDDTLSAYYPDYEIGGDITIDNLLSMQSGIPDYLRSYDEDGYETESSTQAVIDGVEEDNTVEENRAALRKWILSQELLFPQGERFSYSNSNYFLLGEIIEQVSGESYFDYLRTRFFEPLGMETAGYIENYDNSGAAVAAGYRNVAYAEAMTYRGAAFGCGDMMASPKDLYKWTVALHGGKVLGEEMYREMISPHAEGGEGYTSYGYGLMIGDTGAMPYYFHLGTIPCFVSCVVYIPQIDYFVATMSNYSSEATQNVSKDITRIFFEEIGLTPKQS